MTHMADATYDVIGIGNAIVDVIAQADDAFLRTNDLQKGVMTLIGTEEADTLYGKMGPGIEASGGSAGNTMACIASLGGKAAYVGKVCDDQLGKVFGHDIKAIGVDFDTPPLTGSDKTTARCLVLVTPDAQRTMYTYLGACTQLGPDDIREDQIAAAKVTYMEGYLWDEPHAKDAMVKAAAAARDAGRKVALSLSDPFCVDRHREEFRDLADGLVDILFANEQEITSLYQVNSFDEAVEKVKGHVEIAALTKGAEGSVVVTRDGQTVAVPAAPINKVVDTTGAGDAYAAGFLFGYTQGKPLDECARIAGIAAAEVIGHYGARPETPLNKLVNPVQA